MPQRGKGELESAIMNVLWDSSEPLTARQVQLAFSKNTPAITTLITVLDRMVTKGLLTKAALGGRSYTFTPTRSRLDEVTKTMNQALESVGDKEAALMLFAGTLSDEARELLRRAIAK